MPAERIAAELYGLEAKAEKLPGYLDENYLLETGSGERFVLKLAHPSEPLEVLEFQSRAMGAVPRAQVVLPTLDGDLIGCAEGRLVRIVTYLTGTFLADCTPHSDGLLRAVGRFFGDMDWALEGFSHPAMHRNTPWDLGRAGEMWKYYQHIDGHGKRNLVKHFLALFETEALPRFSGLRASVIHNDGNDYNILVNDNEVTGIIDFGDAVHTATVCEVAIASTYAAMSKDDPLAAAGLVVQGYHEAYPLRDEELEVLFPLICARLCTSVCHSAREFARNPENEYIRISEKPAWDLMEKLVGIDPAAARDRFRDACGVEAAGRRLPKQEILELRSRHIGPSLSVSYDKPIEIVRGFLQYLYDEKGRRYLDGVNNVTHVGHCHPKVVEAARRQMANLNTNTRYLHDHLVRYARRLCATLPDPLSICFFVNSGSEANDLALRLAWNHTGRKDLVVVEGAYHGNLSSLIEISPYKFDGPGGKGAPAHVHKVPMPDGYRGPYKGPDTGEQYADHVRRAVEENEVAAFICESLLGCGGQVVPPAGYLTAAARHVREAGALYIADEVQVGFGRAGTHFWAFETQDAVPDIVTLGKPMGNGHPLAAVVTTPEVAASFHTGMEYFNTYGGNPVSCAVGMAVLDVIEEEGLVENARHVGARLKAGLEALQEEYPLIGDVRGHGLFLGAELVRDRDTLEPAAAEAAAIIERMKEAGILVSTDGPLHNVLKMKPPLVFTEADADRLIETLNYAIKDLFF